MEIFCQVTPYGFVPMYDSDLEQKRRFKTGTVVKGTFNQARNPRFHKKFWALARLTFDNLPLLLARQWSINSAEDMVERMKVELGYYDLAQVDGLTVIRPRSISFAKMEQAEFEVFYARCLDLVTKKYLVGTDAADIEQEIVNFM